MINVIGENPKDWIVINAIQTPDGTILRSEYAYDYKTYVDKNGSEYMVDGGLKYLRRSGPKDYKELSKYYTDLTHHELIEELKWGQNYDENMKRLKKTKWIKIKDMSTSHIKNILDGNYCNNPMYLKVFKDELESRK